MWTGRVPDFRRATSPAYASNRRGIAFSRRSQLHEFDDETLAIPVGGFSVGFRNLRALGNPRHR